MVAHTGQSDAKTGEQQLLNTTKPDAKSDFRLAKD
jgi:hypothetical protein